MNEQNYWQQFWDTGRVEDYLSYKNSQKDEEKESADAGTFHGYGDDIKSGTFRGI